MTAGLHKRKPVYLIGDFRRMATAQQRAFALTEVLITLAVLAVLSSVMLPALARTTTQTKIAQCEANLKQDALAMLIFASDNGDVLPITAGGNWPWDLQVRVESELEPYGMHRTQLYDPGFANQNIDQFWNFVPGITGKHITGYAFTLAGVVGEMTDDQNTSLDTQVEQLSAPGSGNYDPQLTQSVPAVNGMIKINPARRVLITDALISNSGQTDPTQYTSYTWALHPESGYPGLPGWNTTPYGPWLGSGTPHLNSQNLPTGANEGMLDGHVKWYPFSGMATHNPSGSGYSGDQFWWQADPGKM